MLIAFAPAMVGIVAGDIAYRQRLAATGRSQMQAPRARLRT